MALIPCPGCGNPVSDRAAKCPHCGLELTPAQRKPAAEEQSVPSSPTVQQPVAVQPAAPKPAPKEPQPAADAPAKSRSAMVWGIAAALLVCAAGALWFMMKPSDAKPHKAAADIEEKVVYDSKEETFYMGPYIVSKNGKYGMLDENEKELLPCEYDEIDLVYPEFLSDPIPSYFVCKNGKWGLINGDYQEVFPCGYKTKDFFQQADNPEIMEFELKLRKQDFASTSGEPELKPDVLQSLLKSVKKYFELDPDFSWHYSIDYEGGGDEFYSDYCLFIIQDYGDELDL